MTAPATDKKRRYGVLAVLAALGPGIIAASAGNDAGGIATYSQDGATYGYKTLWMILLMTFSLVVVQEMAARMGAVSGKGFAALIRERFGIRPTLFAMIALLTSNAATSVAEFAGIAAALELFGITKYVSVPIAAVSVWLLVVRGSYRRVEKILLVMSLVFLAYPLSAIASKPDWAEVAEGHRHPSVRPDRQLRAARHRDHRHHHRAVDAVLRAEQHRRQGRDREGPRPPARGRHRRRGVGQHRRVVHHRDHRDRALPAGRHDHERRAGRRGPRAYRGGLREHAVRDRAARRIAARGVRPSAHRELRDHRGVRMGARHRPHLVRGTRVQRHLHLRHRVRRGARPDPRTLRCSRS